MKGEGVLPEEAFIFTVVLSAARQLLRLRCALETGPPAPKQTSRRQRREPTCQWNPFTTSGRVHSNTFTCTYRLSLTENIRLRPTAAATFSHHCCFIHYYRKLLLLSLNEQQPGPNILVAISLCLTSRLSYRNTDQEDLNSEVHKIRLQINRCSMFEFFRGKSSAQAQNVPLKSLDSYSLSGHSMCSRDT